MDQPPLHELGSAVEEAFQKLLEIEQSDEWLKAQDVTSEAERFQLWGQNLGLFQEGHASLDYRVRDAVIVRDRFAELLRELAEHITELFSILSGERKPAEQADVPIEDDSTSSGSSSQSSVHTTLSSEAHSFHETEFRFRSLTERLDALYSLATRIRNPKNRPSRTNDHLYKHIPEQDRSAYILNREEMEINIVSYILRQHMVEASNREEIETSHGVAFEDIVSQYTSPNCWIVRRTGRANARRKQQLLYWKDHALRLSRVKTKPVKSEGPIPVEQNILPNQHNTPSILDKAQATVPSLATSASKLPSLKPDDLRSVISHQSRVSTVISVQNDDLNWPLPPVIRGNDRYFECPYCRTLCPVKYLGKGAWETHIIHDLQAYHCTYEQCQDPNRLYGSKQEWLDHESQHNRVWICQAHDEEFETRPDYVNHLQGQHPDFQADRLSEVLIDTAIGTSKQIYRNCPFCPTGFAETVEMQRHIAFHLVRLALLALNSAGNDSHSDNESINSSDSHQPRECGRTKSIIGDFGLKHGLQRIPCVRLEIGRIVLPNKSNQMLSFYDSERSVFSFYFGPSDQNLNRLLSEPFFREHLAQRRQREYIIEYHIKQVSSLGLSEDWRNLIISLNSSPRFYMRGHIGARTATQYKYFTECKDFTLAEEVSQVLLHSIRKPPTVELEDFKRLRDWLHDTIVSTHKEKTVKQNGTQWNAAIRALQTANNDIYQWILDVDLGPHPAGNLDQVVPPEDVDNMIIEAEGLSWRSESEYYAAKDKSDVVRVAEGKDDNTAKMDPDCAFCGAPAYVACACEAEHLESAVDAAGRTMVGGMYSHLRNWAKQNSQRYMSQALRQQQAAAHDAKEGPIDTQEQEKTNKIWQELQQEYPRVLDYFFSLAEITLPDDDDDCVTNAPIAHLPKRVPLFVRSEEAGSDGGYHEETRRIYDTEEPSEERINDKLVERPSRRVPEKHRSGSSSLLGSDGSSDGSGRKTTTHIDHDITEWIHSMSSEDE
ncbi:hypothetical protein F5X98DRAFT_233060 [Xylaria grammica]|nr:hypothetical protein F5X98DRAFT_233060 [Xylaria grammica]